MASTCGWRRTRSAVARQSARASPPFTPTSTCDTTDSIRSRTSLRKPFITDRTMISAATPRAMPAIDAAEMNEMKRLRRPDRPARV